MNTASIKDTANRLDKAVLNLRAIESETLNLATSLRVEVLLLAQTRVAIEGTVGPDITPTIVLRLAEAMVIAEECEERANILVQALLSGGRLAAMWGSLLAPGRCNAVALARASSLSTIALAEDFVGNFGKFAGLAAEAADGCRSSVEALREALSDSCR